MAGSDVRLVPENHIFSWVFVAILAKLDDKMAEKIPTCFGGKFRK